MKTSCLKICDIKISTIQKLSYNTYYSVHFATLLQYYLTKQQNLWDHPQMELSPLPFTWKFQNWPFIAFEAEEHWLIDFRRWHINLFFSRLTNICMSFLKGRNENIYLPKEDNSNLLYLDIFDKVIENTLGNDLRHRMFFWRLQSWKVCTLVQISIIC